MKVKININSSETKDMTHYVYKFKNEAYKEGIEDYINNLTPIAEIRESSSSNNIIEFIDENANGLYFPVLKILETKDIISIFQEEKNKRNIYCYRIISKTNVGEITNMSKPISVQVSELDTEISFVVYYKNDINNSNEEWKVYCDKNILEELRLNKNTDLVSEVVSPLTKYDLYIDDSLIRVNNTRILKILNIFSTINEERLYRNSKSFKIKNKYKDLESEFSEIYSSTDRIKVNIDKIEVYRKDVTSVENKDEPISINSKDFLLNRTIRAGGLYKKEEGDIISSEIKSDFLNIKDTCTFTKRYNYTVYLFDERGNISSPIVKVF